MRKKVVQGVSLASRKPSRAPKGPGLVRISGGMYKRTPVPVPDAEGLRPTPERARQTVFNWLGFALGDFASKRFLDMFAGSGVMGLEAASRGAAFVLSCEVRPKAADGIRTLAQRLSAPLEVHCGDAFARLAREESRFDVIFLDPPFASGLHLKALKAADGALAEGGMIYLETPRGLELDFQALGYHAFRSSRAGAAVFMLLKRIGDE